MPVGRLAHTFVTTFDWTPQPAWLGYWLGGINLHLTHHLFPHWHHRHYPALSRIIAQIASQQGLDYQLLTLADLLRLQQQFYGEWGEAEGLIMESSDGGGKDYSALRASPYGSLPAATLSRWHSSRTLVEASHPSPHGQNI